MNKPRILIISEGGKKRGMGHLVRIGSIIDVLTGSYNSTLLINHDSCSGHFLKNRGISLHSYNNYTGMMRFIKASGPYVLVIIDMLHMPRKIIRRIENLCKSLLVFDDMHEFENFRIKGAVIRPQEVFKCSVKSNGRTSVIEGADFFSLRPIFSSFRKSKVFKAVVKNVGLILGGAPFMKDAMFIAKLLDNFLDKDISIHVVAGYSNEKINKHIFSNRVIFYKKVSNMAAFIKNIDLGIISGGFIKFEFMCIGTPFSLISLNAHQDMLAKKFSNNGYGVYLGKIKEIKLDPNKFYKKLKYLISSSSFRKKMFSSSRRLVDGKGRERLLALIKNLTKKGKI